MKTLTMGDFYVWYCEWCDSRNLIPWNKTSSGKVCCGGCHKEYPVQTIDSQTEALAAV